LPPAASPVTFSLLINAAAADGDAAAEARLFEDLLSCLCGDDRFDL
jgi:hypothetical protein